ncbi:hypothetical protein BB560_006811 [Smittium megazygosporum]|nr:hypothetical protein BB560_006811 [Smittium megazygosporum]
MISYKENQCVIISGESGAGKTEAAKRILEYISAVSGASSSSIQKVKDMVLATNPLLESFGNAKTLRNNNSSRFGKYLEVQFNYAGEPMGAKITNYLLEKIRVVSQIKNERNFHIFYQLTKAAPQHYRDMFGISNPGDYAYISAAGCIDVQNIDDSKDYREVIDAMNVIGLSQEEQTDLHRMLAIVLWLGNVNFTENDASESSVSTPQVVEFLAYLFEANVEFLTQALETRTIETQRGGRRGSVYKVPLNRAQAIAARDGLAMAIYSRMFDWIVGRVNLSLETKGSFANDIGILDIYGFEIFDNNSFEQLCINYVNEKLQQIFIELTLKAEQDEYVREQIEWTPIEYFNNKVVCDLIEIRRPPGIFATMNDAVATAHADPVAADNALQQRLGSISSEYFESRNATFTIKHYAGNVSYNIFGMTDKNKDQVFRDHLELCVSSKNRFLVNTFAASQDPDSKKRPPTASDVIKTSANDLMVKLAKCQPSYIRTIKPNENKSATEFDERRVLHQVKYLGLCENIRIRRAGFAYRQTFEKFVERFYLLSSSTSYAGEYTWRGDAKSACAQIFRDTNIDRSEWQLGSTKAFIRHPETLWALENMRERYWYNMAVRIQKAWRRYVAYKNECARKIQNAYRRNKNTMKYVQMREYGNRILANRKERRRYSLISMRTFFGDYLGVGSPTSEQGSITKSTIRLQPGDRIIFSSQIEFLAARQLRSAKPANRILVVTNQYMFVVAQVVERGLYKQVLEHTAALVSISSIGTSPFQDGWVVFNIERQPSFVLQCDFKTELLTHICTVTNARIPVTVAQQLDYFNKKMKSSKLVFSKNEAFKNEVYKSKSVSVATGMPPDSPSNPPARRNVKQKPEKKTYTAPATNRQSQKPAFTSMPQPSVQTQIQTQTQSYSSQASQPMLSMNNNTANNNMGINQSSQFGAYQNQQNPITNANNFNQTASNANNPRLNGLSTQPAAARPNVSSNQFKSQLQPQAQTNTLQQKESTTSRPFSKPNNPVSNIQTTIAQENTNNIYTRPAANQYKNNLKSTLANKQNEKQQQPIANKYQRQPAPPPPVNTNPVHVALYDYVPQNSGEMALENNTKYEITSKDPNGWWFGKNSRGESGWIPSNYLDPTPAPAQAALPARPQFQASSVASSKYGVDSGSGSANSDTTRVSFNPSSNENSMAQLAAALAEWPMPGNSQKLSQNQYSSGNKQQGSYKQSNMLANARNTNDDSDDEEAWD